MLFRKNTCLLLILFLTHCATLITLNINPDIEEAKNYIPTYCEGTVNYIKKNFDKFIESMNSNCNSDEKLNATSIEKQIEVLINEGNETKKGILIDFNEDNGYMLLSDNYSIYDLNNNGESPFKDIDSTNYYYSVNNGYGYLNDLNEIIPVDYDSNENDVIINKSSRINSEDYLTLDEVFRKTKDKGFYIMEDYNLDNVMNLSQEELSIYTKSVGYNGTMSEGNCSLVSIYSGLQYVVDNWFSYSEYHSKYNGGDYLVYYKPQEGIEKKLYESKKNQGYNIEYKELPSTYIVVRETAIRYYGRVEGFNKYEESKIIDKAASELGVSVTANIEYLWWNGFDSMLNQIKNEETPVILSIDTSNGGHSVLLHGYKQFRRKVRRKVRNIWVTRYEWKTYLKVNHWHKNIPGNYIDYDEYKNAIKNQIQFQYYY